MSDAEWAMCEPLLPHPAWLADKGGPPSGYCMRDIVDWLTHRLKDADRLGAGEA
jgi:hypothetical protein